MENESTLANSNVTERYFQYHVSLAEAAENKKRWNRAVAEWKEALRIRPSKASYIKPKLSICMQHLDDVINSSQIDMSSQVSMNQSLSNEPCLDPRPDMTRFARLYNLSMFYWDSNKPASALAEAQAAMIEISRLGFECGCAEHNLLAINHLMKNVTKNFYTPHPSSNLTPRRTPNTTCAVTPSITPRAKAVGGVGSPRIEWRSTHGTTGTTTTGQVSAQDILGDYDTATLLFDRRMLKACETELLNVENSLRLRQAGFKKKLLQSKYIEDAESENKKTNVLRTVWKESGALEQGVCIKNVDDDPYVERLSKLNDDIKHVQKLKREFCHQKSGLPPCLLSRFAHNPENLIECKLWWESIRHLL